MTTLELGPGGAPAGRPLALVAEDNPFLRENTVRILDGRGVSAIAVGSVEQAASALQNSPRVDVALLDIHLAADKDLDDKGGVAIARLLRTHYRGTKIIGYSGRFHERDLAEAELALFDETHAKGLLTQEEHEELWATCAHIGRESFFLRRVEGEQKADELKRLYEQEFQHIEVLRRFQMDDASSDELTAEGALGLSGYKIRLVHLVSPRGVPSKPFVVWKQDVFEEGNRWVNMELYGWPEIYSSGTDEVDALMGLAQAMHATREDIESSDEPDDRDQDLHAFLRALEP